MKFVSRLLVPMLLLLWRGFLPAAEQDLVRSVSLEGAWRFELDPKDVGVRERWFEKSLSGRIKLPGSLPAQGVGEKPSLNTKWVGGIRDKDWYKKPVYAPYSEPDNFKFPFWLQPETYYAGAAWYQMDIDVPARWAERRIVLELERPHCETRVWVDGRQIGTNRSLSTPHVYDLGVGLSPGKHQLTLRVDNGVVIDVGENSHCVSDHTQGNWNGVVGYIRLSSTAAVWVQDLQVFPNFAGQSATVRVKIGNATGTAGSGRLRLRVDEATERGMVPPQDPRSFKIKWGENGGDLELEMPIFGPRRWDEFEHHGYYLSAVLEDSGEQKSVRFGFRDIATQGTQFLINGRKTFFRGTLECCIFPKTGHPPVDIESWRKVIRAAQAHGLNMIRFHSYCPPEAAFLAADELGFYYQVETCWANDTVTLGDGKPVDDWVREETDRILKEYGNHPSFVLMAYGNEPGGRNANKYLAKYVNDYRAKDTRRLWTSGSGWPQLAENEFHVTPDPRVQAWGAGLKSRINATPPETRTDYRSYIQARPVPVISHEIGQWCVYPNFDEIPKYTGYLKPKNFEIFRDTLSARHMGDQARDFLHASGKLQTLCYKEDIEAALRTPGMGGFQLLDLHDFPGQGTALVGVLDPFWESKGYVTPEQFRRFCGPTVVLTRMNRRIFTTAERFEADLEVAHFGSGQLNDVVTEWVLETSSGQTVGSGRFERKVVPVDNAISLGQVAVDLKSVAAPVACRLVARLSKGSEHVAENDWNIWIYPDDVPAAPPSSVLVTSALDTASERLKQGGRVLLVLPPGRVKGDANGKVGLGFSSIFWNTAWTDRQPPHTLGVLCKPEHPALADFPTDTHSDWQWWYVITRSGAMILDALPTKLRPPIQVIDDWVTNRKLGLLFEAKLGPGKLMVASIDFGADGEQNVVIRQLRKSILNYMESDRFDPGVQVTCEDVKSLVTEASNIQKMGARTVSASGAQRGHEAEYVLDGDPGTTWEARRTAGQAQPQELTIALEKPSVLRGIELLPRQDGEAAGIKEYEVFLSDSWENWDPPAAKGRLGSQRTKQRIEFAPPREARFLKIVVLSSHATDGSVSLAEIDVF